MLALRLLVALAAVLGLALAADTLRGGEEALQQPLAFDHALHAKQGIACDDCHSKADEGPYATLPSLKQCLLCHAEEEDGAAAADPPPDPAAAARLRELASALRAYDEAGAGIPWLTVNRVAGHVYFSHVAHVRFAKMECAECHGDMAVASRPPPRSQVEHLTMARCMECHAERGASNDCLACHK